MNTLPFQYLVRGQQLQYLNGDAESQAIEQRDVELEDYLGRIPGVGAGIPPGGTTAQVLAKKSAADYDVQWVTAPTATLLRAVGGAGSTIPPSGTYVPFSVTVPAVAWPRVLLVTWQYYVAISAGAGGSCVGALYDGSSVELSSVTTTTSFLAGTYTETLAANTARSLNLRLTANAVTVTVFADGHTNHINITGLPA